MVIRIDIVFDTICPWCFIGKRRLERALAQRPHVFADLHWRPFLLNPDMPLEGIDRRAYLDRKFGSTHRIQRVLSTVAQAGLGESIEFRFDLIDRTPSTAHSHRLVRYAHKFGLQSQAVEEIYQAYFSQGADIGDISVLGELAARIGLPQDETIAYLRSDDDLLSVMQENARAHRLGVSGVPSFMFNEAYAIAGAQEGDILLRMIDLATESRQAESPAISEISALV